MCTWWGRLALKLQPRQYTYKFAGKIVTMVPQLREEKLSLPDEVLQLYHEHGTFPLFVVMLPSIAHVMVNHTIFKIYSIWYSWIRAEERPYKKTNLFWFYIFFLSYPRSPSICSKTHVQVLPGNLPSLFACMPWDDESVAWCEEADLRDALRYVRGSKLLKIPLEWRVVLPTHYF